MTPTAVAGIIGLVVCLTIKDTRHNRRIICVIACVCFILQAGLRDYMHASNDTYNYLRAYWALMPESFSEILHSNSFTFNIDDYSSRDPGYSIFVKLTQIIYPDFRFFLIIVAIIISTPIIWIIYKFTDSLQGIIIACILYEALFAGFFETGIRQTIAMGLIYFSLPFVEKRKWLPHYCIIALAYFIHSSALIFIPFYPLTAMKPNRNLSIAIILTPVFMAFASAIVTRLGTGTMFESYATTTVDNQGTPVFSALLFTVCIGAWIYRKHFSEKNIKDRMLLTGLICSLSIMPTSWVNSNFIRLVFYFLVFLMPMIPRIVQYITPNYNLRNIISLTIGIVLILLK